MTGRLTAEERYAVENAIARAYGAGPNPRGAGDVSGAPTPVTEAVERILADRAAPRGAGVVTVVRDEAGNVVVEARAADGLTRMEAVYRDPRDWLRAVQSAVEVVL